MEKQAIDKIVKTLDGKYKKEGKLTYDDVTAALGSTIDPDTIDEVLSGLAGLGIDVEEPRLVKLNEKIENEIKRLIKVGKTRGHLTYDDVGEKFSVFSAKTVFR